MQRKKRSVLQSKKSVGPEKLKLAPPPKQRVNAAASNPVQKGSLQKLAADELAVVEFGGELEGAGLDPVVVLAMGSV